MGQPWSLYLLPDQCRCQEWSKTSVDWGFWIMSFTNEVDKKEKFKVYKKAAAFAFIPGQSGECNNAGPRFEHLLYQKFSNSFRIRWRRKIINKPGISFSSLCCFWLSKNWVAFRTCHFIAPSYTFKRRRGWTNLQRYILKTCLNQILNKLSRT